MNEIWSWSTIVEVLEFLIIQRRIEKRRKKAVKLRRMNWFKARDVRTDSISKQLISLHSLELPEKKDMYKYADAYNHFQHKESQPHVQHMASAYQRRQQHINTLKRSGMLYCHDNEPNQRKIIINSLNKTRYSSTHELVSAYNFFRYKLFEINEGRNNMCIDLEGVIETKIELLKKYINK